MSEKTPVVDGHQLLKILGKIGYSPIRQRGSHVQVMKQLPNGLVSTFPVPVHGRKPLRSGTLRSILDSAGLTVDDLRKLL